VSVSRVTENAGAVRSLYTLMRSFNVRLYAADCHDGSNKIKTTHVANHRMNQESRERFTHPHVGAVQGTRTLSQGHI
jgi:hypothetical protein